MIPYHLTVSVADHTHPERDGKTISLSAYPSLRTCHAHIACDPLDDAFHDEFSWFYSPTMVPHGLASWRDSRLLSDTLRTGPPALRAVHIVLSRAVNCTNTSELITSNFIDIRRDTGEGGWEPLFETLYTTIYENALVPPCAPGLDWAYLDDTFATIGSLQHVSIVYRLIWPEWSKMKTWDSRMVEVAERTEGEVEADDEPKAAFAQAVREGLPKTCARGCEVEVCCEVVKCEPILERVVD